MLRTLAATSGRAAEPEVGFGLPSVGQRRVQQQLQARAGNPFPAVNNIPFPCFVPCCAQVLLIENDINTNPFTPAVHACVPPLPWSVSEADVADPSRWAGT